DDRNPIPPAFLQLFFRGYCSGLLPVVLIENDRPVLRAGVRTLPVESRRIVVFPEHFQEVLVRNLGRVVFHLHGFSVSGPARADVSISRILQSSPHISHRGIDDTGNLTKRGFGSPKTTHPKSGLVHTIHSFSSNITHLNHTSRQRVYSIALP